jgi:hypothetical protein
MIQICTPACGNVLYFLSRNVELAKAARDRRRTHRYFMMIQQEVLLLQEAAWIGGSKVPRDPLPLNESNYYDDQAFSPRIE